MSRSLQGKVALITGGTRSAGAPISQALAKQGACVAVTYAASPSKAREHVASLQSQGVQALAFKHDPSDTKGASPMVNEVVKAFGQLDILVNASSVALYGKTIDDPTINNAAMDLPWQVNVHGLIAVIRASVQHLRFNGRIITLSSGLAIRAGFAGVADYGASKAAIVGYTKGIARDLAGRGITANVILAGTTEMDRSLTRNLSLAPEPHLGNAIKRAATTEEVAESVVYLASPLTSFVTGSVLDLTGGYLA